MDRKIRVGVIFGGKSAEHEVSLQSAQSILRALGPGRFEVTLIAIDKRGEWSLCDDAHYLTHADDPAQIALQSSANPVALISAGQGWQVASRRLEQVGPLDVVFPVLHGPFGEDGTVQGLLKLANIPFVGAGVLGSAIGMDKDVAKRLLRDAGVPSAKFITLTPRQAERISFNQVAGHLGTPFFIKPANMGSSVGVHKVADEAEFADALQDAFAFDTKVLIEEFVNGRELECAVLGNDDPQASCVGEIIPTHDFYSYEAKYLDENGALLRIPAEIDDDTAERVRELAVRAFQALCCEGMARVDFFLRVDGEVLVNEINTIPGFTSISMFPKLWEASGLPYGKLAERLFELAIERFERESRLKTSI
ncbi:MAG: D-alanine--D-alanine ligase [Armatimonadota bacterium]